MQPPICDLCAKDFRNELESGGLVQFRLTPEDLNFNKQLSSQGMVGHKKGLSWFCGDHLALAQSFVHFHQIDALRLMREMSR